ncbi:peptidoglycan-binding domain-containing protein, partial [Ilumatobacter sp.]|uniref:peptidoglycan-binding domain-containing protein n=1 Tax=Ilumatobacter sp. TaxID=1967498 RepID=UPI003AF789D9
MGSPNLGTRSHHNPPSEPLLTRRQLMFAGAASAATIGVWARASGSPSVAEQSAATTTSMIPTPKKTVAPPATTGAPTTTTPFTPLPHDLSEGMVDSKVEAMQALLTSRQFDPGPIDGIFGGATKRAVWAFEKIVLGTPRSEIRGVVTPAMWAEMNGDFGVSPRRSPGGNHMEVYLPEQVSVLFFDGAPRVISHVSSGEGITWCDEVEIDLDDGTTETKGICGKSVTPGGVYHFERKVEGWRNAKLGRLYKPVYFNYGIAIHGAGNVPDYP